MVKAGINLIKHCAQVYFDTNGLLLFHCVLCESQRLKNMKEICRHLSEKHKNILIELKTKQNDQFVKLDNEININECNNSNGQFEDSMCNEEENSCASVVIMNEVEAEFIDDEELTQFCFEEIATDDNNTDEIERDESSSRPYEENENEIEFIDHNEETKLFNENSEEQLKDASIEAEDSTQTVVESFTPAREKLAPYYASRTNGEGEYPCPVCDRSFSKKGILSHHVRRHKAPQLECDHCSKKFHTRTELNHHKRRINGVKPYMCTECGRQYSTSGALTEHMKRHLDIRNVECDVCGKRFYDRGHLKHHYVVHTRERAFTCKICNSKFARRKSLVSHMKIHANKREYVCKVCGASFNQLPGLHVHMRTKHKDVIHPKDETIL